MALNLILLIMITILVIYILYIQNQIKNINKQINLRMNEDSRQPIQIQLINKHLNTLVSDFNRILNKEENLRIKIIKHEEKIKDMIANISHDLRTPLTAVKGYMQLLEKSIKENKQGEMVGICLNHINELEKLINSFFELSYLEVSKPEINLKKINLTNMVSNMIADYVYQFEEHDIQVKYTNEKPMYIYADENSTKRIINNLIKNSICHSAGNLQIDIHKNEYINLSFKNPILEEAEINVENLFDRFYVADKSRNKRTTGLGLSIVKILAEQMGGKVYADIKDNMLEIGVQFKKYSDE